MRRDLGGNKEKSNYSAAEFALARSLLLALALSLAVALSLSPTPSLSLFLSLFWSRNVFFIDRLVYRIDLGEAFALIKNTNEILGMQSRLKFEKKKENQ